MQTVVSVGSVGAFAPKVFGKIMLMDRICTHWSQEEKTCYKFLKICTHGLRFLLKDHPVILSLFEYFYKFEIQKWILRSILLKHILTLGEVGPIQDLSDLSKVLTSKEEGKVDLEDKMMNTNQNICELHHLHIIKF